jgi:circadian clock protein KaiB
LSKEPNRKGDDGSGQTFPGVELSDSGQEGDFVLRLFVTGTTPRSVQAISNIKKICEEHLKGRYELEVVDVYQQPELARKEQIVAVPTLIKELPRPLRKLIGDLSDTQRVLVGLDLKHRK